MALHIFHPVKSIQLDLERNHHHPLVPILHPLPVITALCQHKKLQPLIRVRLWATKLTTAHMTNRGPVPRALSRTLPISYAVMFVQQNARLPPILNQDLHPPQETLPINLRVQYHGVQRNDLYLLINRTTTRRTPKILLPSKTAPALRIPSKY
jgi:hypothetical protein